MSAPIPPAAVSVWREIREIQNRSGGSEPCLEDAQQICRLVAQLRGLFGFARHCEPHRIRADRQPWRWLYLPENWERYETALQLADQLDAALAATPADRAA